MSRRILLLVGLILMSALPASLAWQASPASAANASVANKYLSCTYPKSTPGKYIPNARSWQEQGFTKEIRGIDISVWQHPNGQSIDFARLKSDFDISFVIIKSSDGGLRGNENAKKWFPIDSAAAKAQGLIVGGYHYALPGNMDPNTITDAKLQARRAVEQANGAAIGDLPLTLDIEELPCGWTITRLAKWTSAFLEEAERITGRTPIIYANGSFIARLEDAGASDLARYPLWLAKWGPKLGTDPRENRIWNNNWTIWQFTADGQIDAVPSNSTDLNIFNGTKEEFQSFINQ
jgi:lysozyme